jgi:hypothetical protein
MKFIFDFRLENHFIESSLLLFILLIIIQPSFTVAGLGLLCARGAMCPRSALLSTDLTFGRHLSARSTCTVCDIVPLACV